MCHYVLRALKTCLLDPRCQTYVFKTQITWGIQKWVQNNQLSSLPKKTVFGAIKSSKTLDILMIFELLWQCIWLNYTSLKKNCRKLRISWNTKMINFFICNFLFLKIRCLRSIVAIIARKKLIFKRIKSHEKINQFLTFW